MGRTVERTRGAGKYTEAQFFGAIRSALRKFAKWWPPKKIAKEAARRPNESANKRLKWEFQCAHCGEWFPDADVQVDHVIPCGSLKCYEDIPQFCERLFVEDPAGLQVLCKPHHQEKTNRERALMRQGIDPASV